ncbi:hypothetical protein HanRHA438_Chr17g0816831 [Helianthus annuus]|nr:hypothetical protein HanRHA438_Chr17g0816831 [Helianthus annuus]
MGILEHTQNVPPNHPGVHAICSRWSIVLLYMISSLTCLTENRPCPRSWSMLNRESLHYFSSIPMFFAIVWSLNAAFYTLTSPPDQPPITTRSASCLLDTRVAAKNVLTTSLFCNQRLVLVHIHTPD